jgi:hypothetical protein
MLHVRILLTWMDLHACTRTLACAHVPWPTPGSASYSAFNPNVRPPVPWLHVATNAVGSDEGLDTLNPNVVSASTRCRRACLRASVSVSVRCAERSGIVGAQLKESELGVDQHSPTLPLSEVRAPSTGVRTRAESGAVNVPCSIPCTNAPGYAYGYAPMCGTVPLTHFS